MNIKYSYHVHKYYTGGSHDFHILSCTTSVYQNGFFRMDLKSYNKLPKKVKILYLVILKKCSQYG